MAYMDNNIPVPWSIWDKVVKCLLLYNIAWNLQTKDCVFRTTIAQVYIKPEFSNNHCRVELCVRVCGTDIGMFNQPLWEVTTSKDHPFGGWSQDERLTWLITMVIVLFPFQMAFPWLINWGDPNHLLTGMILQAGIPNPSEMNGIPSLKGNLGCNSRGNWNNPNWKTVLALNFQQLEPQKPAIQLPKNGTDSSIFQVVQKLTLQLSISGVLARIPWRICEKWLFPYWSMNSVDFWWVKHMK